MRWSPGRNKARSIVHGHKAAGNTHGSLHILIIPLRPAMMFLPEERTGGVAFQRYIREFWPLFVRRIGYNRVVIRLCEEIVMP